MSNRGKIILVLMSLMLMVCLSIWVQAQDILWEGDPGEEVMAAYDFGTHLFNTMETEGVEDFVSEDWLLHDPSNSGYAGTDGFIAWAQSFHALMPDFELFHIDPLMGSDDYLAWRWEFTGTHTGEVPDIAPSNNEIYMTGMVFHHIVDGQFAESWVYYDNMALLTQLGVLPAPEDQQ